MVTSLRLTEICLRDSKEYSNFQKAITALPLLSHLELQLKEVNPPPQESPVLLAALQHLHVDFEHDPRSLHAIIKPIRAPSLLCLSLSGWRGPGAALNESTLAATRFPSLRNIILSNYISSGLDEIKVLSKAFPDIERVTFQAEDGSSTPSIYSILRAFRDSYHNRRRDEDMWRGERVFWRRLQTISVSAMEGTVNHFGPSSQCNQALRGW